jgi:hypothetical protein
VAAGTVVGVLGMFANRIQRMEGAGLKLELAAAAISTLEAAKDAEQQGRPEVAEALRNQAQSLISAVEPLALKYEHLRREIPSGWNRTVELERLTADQGKLLAPSYPDVASVERLFDTGTDGYRFSAIAIMEQNPAVASPRAVAAAVQDPRSKFEQYHALKVIEAMAIRDPLSPKLAELRSVIASELSGGNLGSDEPPR